MAKKKYYAVKAGRVPGIYQTWDECKAQVDGYPGAKYQGFASEPDAMAYLDGKEETVRPEERTESALPAVRGPYAFVDGSFHEATGTYGYGGFLCVDGASHTLQGSGNDAEYASMRNVAGEISGAMAAVRKAEELGIPDLTILYDYNGIEHWTTDWKANLKPTRDYQAFMRSGNRTVSVSFVKVKGHTGIDGNEVADVLAKEAAGVELKRSERARLQEFRETESHPEQQGRRLSDLPWNEDCKGVELE